MSFSIVNGSSCIKALSSTPLFQNCSLWAYFEDNLSGNWLQKEVFFGQRAKSEEPS